VIEVDGLSAGYSGVPVVRDVSLEVTAGEVVALLGPNGAGKTTTLLALSGLVKPLGGTIRVLGKEHGRGAPERIARRGLAHVPEDRGIFFSLTTAENLRLGTAGRKDAIERALQYFPELEPLLRRRAGQLSGGEQQMLAIARALASQPSALLVDEMSLGLAPVIVQRLLPVIRQIATDHAIGVLLVEQHTQLALHWSDRAYVLSRGQIVLEGDSATLRKRPEMLQMSYLGEAAAE
jgi:branched-chain amino acid transport system ATP-binding protein